MRTNKISIIINRSVQDVYIFTTTPSNSKLWIPSITKEETNEWPIRKGTIYKHTNKNGEHSEVVVNDLKENKKVEWVSMDGTYHCKYIFRPINRDVCELEYYEWVDKGELQDPFTINVLKKLKAILEK